MANNKKIALVTCYFQHNFGSQLQAFATQHIFDKMNVANETILIDGLKGEINKAKMRYFLSRITDLNTIKDKWATVKKVWSKKTNKTYRSNLAERGRMFQNFADTQFHLSKRYDSKQELGNNARNYGAFVVGSDQLWLPSNIEGDYYTLNYVPNDVAKIALSTSFGVSQLPAAQAEKATRFLNRLDFISIREISGQKLIKQLTGKDVPVVCDPTLLFSATEWNELIPQKRFIQGKYIFCYFLGNNPWQRKMVQNFKKQFTDIKIVQLKHCDEYIKSDESFADETPFNVGPLEFVQLVRDAEYVFTDSFHCSVFSMLFSKQFITMPRYAQNSAVSTNGRLSSLLSLVGLEERYVSQLQDISPLMNNAVNYTRVHSALKQLRDFTKQWLQAALTKAGVSYDQY